MAQAAAQEVRQQRPQAVLHHQHRRLAGGLLAFQGGGGLFHQGVGEAGLQCPAAVQRLAEHLLEVAVQADYMQFVLAREPLMGNGAAQRHAHLGGEFVGVGVLAGVFRQGVEDGAHIADRDVLFQQVLQQALQHGERHRLGHHVFHQRLAVLTELVEQLLHFLAAEHFRGMVVQQMVEMGGHHGAGVDHGVAVHLGLLALVRVDPYRRQSEGRVLGGGALHFAGDLARVDRQPLAGEGFAAPHFGALEGDHIAVGAQVQVVADVHHRRQEAHLLGEFLAHALDAAEQLALLAVVHQGNHAVAHFQAQHVDQLNVVPARFRRFRLRRRRRVDLLFGEAVFLGAAQVPGGAGQAGGEQQEHEVGHAGHQAQQAHHAGGQDHHPRVHQQLADHLLADVLVGGHPGHGDAGGGGNHQRRNLRHQAVADGQQGVGAAGVGERHIVLQHADQQAADDVHRHDHQAGHGVAPDELAGTVHGAVEIRFLGHFGAAFLGVFLADQAGVEVGVDGHLLAGHGIEHEARAHLGDAPGAFGDHHEVDHHQNQEHHQTDGEVAAHQELAERLDHLAGGSAAFVAFHQHHPGGGHVQGQPQQGGEQQHRREGGELQRAQGEHADQQHHQRQGDVEGKEHIQRERRQRQDQHGHDQQDQDRPGEHLGAAVAEQLAPAQVVAHRFHGATSSSAGIGRSAGVSGWSPPSSRARLRRNAHTSTSATAV